MAKQKRTANRAISPEYLAFVEWEATPASLLSEEDPKTMGEYAEKIGVSRKTLYDWRKFEGHMSRVTAIYNKYHSTRLNQVRNALLNRAIGVTVETHDKKGELIYKNLPPDPKAIELFLKYEDKWQDKIKAEVEGTLTINADESAKAVLEAIKAVKK